MKILWVEDFAGASATGLASLIFAHDPFSAEAFHRLLDDDQDLSGQLNRVLVEAGTGYEVTLCRSYMAWREHHGESFDLAILDLNLDTYETPPAAKPAGTDEHFDRIAGLYIYQQLKKDGFVDDNIVILTGESGTLTGFISLCQGIFVDPPLNCFEKRDGDLAKLRQWLRTKSQIVSKHQSRVFISYAREDRSLAEELVGFLEESGFRTWFDQRDLLPGTEWSLEIQKAIESCQFFAACMSRQSVDKEGYFQKELREGLRYLEMMPEGAIFLIPLRLEKCSLPRKFSHLQWCNFFESDGRGKLLATLRIGAEKRGLTTGPLVKEA